MIIVRRRPAERFADGYGCLRRLWHRTTPVVVEKAKLGDQRQRGVIASEKSATLASYDCWRPLGSDVRIITCDPYDTNVGTER